MTREEILAKSRMENKGKDISTIDADNKSCAFAITISSVFAIVLFLMQLFTGNGINHSIWSMITAMNATMYFRKYYSLKDKKDLTTAVLWTFTSVIATIMTIVNFIS